MATPSGAYVAGLRAAREVVARQTSLTELVHFERPSDFRKGVVTCLVALDNAIREAEASSGSSDSTSPTSTPPNPAPPDTVTP